MTIYTCEKNYSLARALVEPQVWKRSKFLKCLGFERHMSVFDICYEQLGRDRLLNLSRKAVNGVRLNGYHGWRGGWGYGNTLRENS